ncbi:MAG: hypothetical protein HQK57_11245 [Deltaproteobacteria bacterium]|nr:hypothetical protein [Deltaproteobacteria bacterium]
MLAVDDEADYAVLAKERQQEHGGTAPGVPKILVANLPEVIQPTSARDDAARDWNVSARSVQDATTGSDSRFSGRFEMALSNPLSTNKTSELVNMAAMPWHKSFDPNNRLIRKKTYAISSVTQPYNMRQMLCL